jgi:hypothetical protein
VYDLIAEKGDEASSSQALSEENQAKLKEIFLLLQRDVQDQVKDADLLREVLTVKIRQPSHEFTFGVGMSFIPYPLVLTPVV